MNQNKILILFKPVLLSFPVTYNWKLLKCWDISLDDVKTVAAAAGVRCIYDLEKK